MMTLTQVLIWTGGYESDRRLWKWMMKSDNEGVWEIINFGRVEFFKMIFKIGPTDIVWKAMIVSI